jgi:hypothetical protein
VWEDAETLYVVAWKALAPALLEDLSLIFGKVVLQKETGERDALIALIKAHAADQPISELPE